MNIPLEVLDEMDAKDIDNYMSLLRQQYDSENQAIEAAKRGNK